MESQEIQKHEQQLALTEVITNCATTAIFVMDSEGRCTFMNPAAEEMTGFLLSDIKGEVLHDKVHYTKPDGSHFPITDCPIGCSVMAKQSIRKHEDTFIRKDGTFFPVRSSAVPLLNGDNLIGIVLEVQDITDEKIAEERLKQREEEFRILADNITQLAWMADGDGAIFWYNQRWFEFTGLNPETQTGHSWQEVHHPEHYSRVMDKFRSCIDSGYPWEDTFPLRRCDGIYRWFLSRARPISDSKGSIVRWIGTNTDITEQITTERRLRLLDAISQATREAADPGAIMNGMTELLGEHLKVSRCAYADVEPDNNRFTIRHDWTEEGATSTVGVYSLDLFGPRAASSMRHGRTLVVNDVDRELVEDHGAEMFNAIRIKAIICCPLVKEGKLVAMMAVHHQSPRTWNEDEISLVQEVVDRSWAHIERVRAAEILREADRRKDEFIATLAHELRNPLAPIRTGLHILKKSNLENPSALRAREMMERQLLHMVRLIDDLLDVSRISRGALELKKERVVLQSALQDALEATRPLIESARHELEVQVPDEPITLEGDPTRLAQVISNLLNNAAKYTPAGGKITLRIQRIDQKVAIAVQDTGVGIDKEMLPAVFEMFTQVQRTIERSQGGLGIGLSLVKRLVEMHGGSIKAESLGRGAGSTFTVYLPVVEEAREETKEDALRVDLEIEVKRRVLVVDDSIDGATSLALMLEILGCEVLKVHNGPDALKAALSFQPKVIFLDIGLPGMTGYEVAEALKKERPAIDTILVAVTGWGSDEDKRKAKNAGFDRHLTKPVDIALIEEILSSIA